MRKLTNREVDHLLTLLDQERQAGTYYGNQAQYKTRQDRIEEWLREHAGFPFYRDKK